MTYQILKTINHLTLGAGLFQINLVSTTSSLFDKESSQKFGIFLGQSIEFKELLQDAD
jgi:hypothetical protein